MKRKKDAEVASIGGVSTMPAAALVPTQSPVSAPKAAWETELPEIVVSAERVDNPNVATIGGSESATIDKTSATPVSPIVHKKVEEPETVKPQTSRDVTVGIPTGIPLREPKDPKEKTERIRGGYNPLAGLGKGIAQLAAMVDVNRDKRSVRSYERANERLAARESRAADRRQRDAENAAIAREEKNAARVEDREAAAAERSVRREERADARAEAKDVRAQAKESQRRAVDDERRSVGLDRLNNQEMAGIGTPVDGAIDDVTIDAQRFARGKAIEEPDVAASRAARRQQEDVSAESAPMTDAEVASAREARGYAATPQGATKAEGNTGDSKPLTEEKTSVATENSGVDPSLWQVAAKDGDTGTVKNDRANATIEKVAEEAKKADDPLAFLTQFANQIYSDEDRKADEKKKKAAQWILAAQMLGDSIGALSNVYWTGKGANAQKFEPGAPKAAAATYQLEQDIRNAREKAAKAQYDATLMKYKVEMEKTKADRENADADRKHEETVRHNKATEDISRLSAENAAKSANTAMYNAETSRMNAATASRNASVNEAEERRKAEQYNKQHGDRKFLIGDQWVNIPKDKWEGVVGSIYNSLPEEVRKVYETQVTDELGIRKETRKAPTIAVMDAAVRQYAQDPAVMEAILKAAGVKVEEITNDEFGTGGGRGASAAPSNVQTGKEVTTPTAKKKVW